MSRFPNPHMPFNPLQQQNMQVPVNNPMQNNQIVMTPNGPMVQILTPQGPMMVPYNPNMQPPMMNNMQPQMYMQPPMANNMQYPGNHQFFLQTPIVQHNRFENVSGVNNPMSITSPAALNSNQQYTTENAYRSTNLQESVTTNSSFNQPEKENKPMKQAKEFVVNIKNPTKVKGTNFTYGSYISEIKPNNIIKLNDNSINVDCFEEIIETIIEDTNNSSPVPFITYQNFILSNSLYNVLLAEKIKEIFSQNNIKHIYKDLKNLYKEISDSNNYYAFNFINELFTSYINEFLQVSLYEEEAYIDSFIDDFNELLKLLRNNTEETEDELINYLDYKVTQINDTISIINDNPLTNSESDKSVNKNKKLIIPEVYDVVYVNKLDEELGLDILSNNKYVYVPNIPPNGFITSIAKVVKEKYIVNEFYMVTLNRKVIKMFVYKDNTYILKIN